MKERLALAPALLLVLMAAACSTPDETPRQKTPKGPQFDADYYAQNAKQYIDTGHYAQAKDQWQKQLSKDPENWMAHMGIAFSDYFLSEESVTQRGNLDEGRRHLKDAESRFQKLRSGPIEADTEKVDPTRPQWRAELGLALTKRRLGYLDHLEARRNSELARKGGPEAAMAASKADELTRSGDQDYAEAIDLFTGIAHMQHASPEAIMNLGELYVVTKQDAMAERELRRYLDIAYKSHDYWEQQKKDAAKKTASPDDQKVLVAVYDEKLASSGAKILKVMTDLADLEYSRADYNAARQDLENALKVDPNRKDLCLKLAQCESQLDMLESAIQHVDEFLRRASQRNQDFGPQIQDAMKLRAEIDGKMKARGGK